MDAGLCFEYRKGATYEGLDDSVEGIGIVSMGMHINNLCGKGRGVWNCLENVGKVIGRVTWAKKPGELRMNG